MVNINKSDLVGMWHADPESFAHGETENSSLEFNEDGSLIFTTHEQSTDKKSFLVYEVKEDVLVTDQLSAPNKVETKFMINSEGKLILDYNGSWSIYIKQ
ncbi:MAG: hypothetical protein GKR93_17920 [Gammaproteobacteria bacterium]|nr:hypothetical protein [Gammaproteobacteria bacterium]